MPQPDMIQESPIGRINDPEIREVSPADMEDDQFFTWFAGLSSGEATFYSRLKDLPSGNVTVYNEFKIALRIDDKPLLDAIHQRLQIGMVHRIKAYGNAKAQAAFRVIAKDELYYSVIPIFEKFPLRSKKQDDFEIWSEIVRLCVETDPVENINRIGDLVQQLKEGRHQMLDMKASTISSKDMPGGEIEREVPEEAPAKPKSQQSSSRTQPLDLAL